MTTHAKLVELATRAQQDARRCYKIYASCRQHWEDGAGFAEFSDVVIWQYRYQVAAEHAVEMLSIVLQRRDYHVG